MSYYYNVLLITHDFDGHIHVKACEYWMRIITKHDNTLIKLGKDNNDDKLEKSVSISISSILISLLQKTNVL